MYTVPIMSYIVPISKYWIALPISKGRKGFFTRCENCYTIRNTLLGDTAITTEVTNH